MKGFREKLATFSRRWQLDRLVTYIKRTNLNLAGATIAYYTILSLVPVLMSVGVLASMVGFSYDSIHHLMLNSLPHDIVHILSPILRSVFKRNLGTLSFAIIVALWGASRVLGVIRQAFNTVHGTPERISSMFARVFGFLWLLVLLAGAGVILLGTSIIRIVINSLPFDVPFLTMISTQTQLYGIVGLWVLLILFNLALPATKLRKKAVVIGSVIETVMLVLVNHGFSLYATIAVRNADFYQALGALLVLMVYINLIGTILVLSQIIVAWLTDLMNPDIDKDKDEPRTLLMK